MKQTKEQMRIDELIEECLCLDEYYFRCKIVVFYEDMNY